MGSVPSLGAMENEDMFGYKKDYRNPLVPIGCDLCLGINLHHGDHARLKEQGAFATAGVLIAGLCSFKQGKSHRSQMLMRARVLMQGATVALMVGTVYYQGTK